MEQFEKLGEFYLGRPFDLSSGKAGEGVVLYDSRDLTTHAVIVGMTGSGKTGLGIDVLEEAAMDGVPAIAVDPKGDLANLLLTFPSLAPDDFRPWVDEGEAARAGLSVDEYAVQQAAVWKKGLGEWGQSGERIAALRRSADFTVWTPGSSAGRPLSLLKALTPPPRPVLEDRELLTSRINSTATSLLSLVGVTSDPLTSREHILVSTIISLAWQNGETLDLDTLIRQVQQPPVQRLGALDIEAIYPAKDRLQLSVQLNGLLAAPGAAQWTEGDPIQIDRLLYDPTGRPRISVISIAHLSDAERMFFVSILLHEVVGWMRTQSGTGSLRAILYMDEVAGYLPPVSNPPSKAAFLLLLKQARAFGLGLVLATQNPVDLDYKALSNIGTWMLGRLQTERDKARVLDGLESAASGMGGLSRAEIDALLSSLGKRVFLLHNVKHNRPITFQTRWTMAYLRGPMTREQLKRLSAGSAGEASTPGGSVAAEKTSSASVAGDVATGASAAGPAVPMAAGPAATTVAGRGAAPPASVAVAEGAGRATPPILPTGVTQVFAPPDPTVSGPLVYAPRAYLSATVRFVDAKVGVDHARVVAKLVPLDDNLGGVNWPSAEHTDLQPGDFESEPREPARFADLPKSASSAKTYATLAKDFGRYVSMTETLTLLRCESLDAVSAVDEDERAFRIRLQVKAREMRDAEKDKLQGKYAPKIQTLLDRISRAEDAKAKQADQASTQKVQAALSIGASVLGFVLGRKGASVSNVGRAVTAARGVTRSMSEAGDVTRASERVEELMAQKTQLEDECAAALKELETKWDASSLPVEPMALKPKKTDVVVQHAVLAWVAEA